MQNHVSDVLDWERDISPYNVVLGIAPPGAGKTYFFNKLVRGEIEGANQGLTVLILENRRIRVDQTIEECVIDLSDDKKMKAFIQKISLGGNLMSRDLSTMIAANLEDMLPEETRRFRKRTENLGVVYNQHACITTARLTYFLRGVYERVGEKFYEESLYESLWNMFDVIVMDEVHAIVMDSDYQDAPFVAFDFITCFLKKCKVPNRHLIMLTATEAPLGKLFSYYKNIHKIDFSKQCPGVKPSKVSFIEKRDVKKEICQKMKDSDTWNCVYFYSSSIISAEEFCEDIDLDYKQVISLFSSEDAFTDLSEEEQERTEQIEELIIKERVVPPEIRVVLSTSKYKEGVDFKWPIDCIYIEAHNEADVVQMAGRARCGGHEVKIVIGSFDFLNYKNIEERRFFYDFEAKELKDINRRFHEEYSSEEKKLMVQLQMSSDEERRKLGIERGRLSHMRFSYFNNQFQMYATRKRYWDYMEKSLIAWYRKDENDLRLGDTDPKYYQRLVQRWFPDVEVEPYISRIYLMKQRLQKALKYGPEISKNAYESLKKDLCEIYGEEHRINTFLGYLKTWHKFVPSSKRYNSYIYTDEPETL